MNLGFTLSEYMTSKMEDNVISISWPRNCPAKKMSVNEYFDASIINQLINSDHTSGLWLLVFLEEWLSQYKK